jgi:hypothetical protein
MNGIILNGRVTIEPCPMMCGYQARCEHGSDDNGRPRHWWSCPNCGDSFSIVCYDCDDCRLPAAPVEERK